ncbi:hypothetical protein VP01_3332g2 [Puccinia sorghi]|uniref:Uncharacterized protein n=1 Tax=Puccinia sorghi TaxID=27349 RepID=A0A0L6UX99_9BASI|nr:hypothetical protein VP01_3332g2 [Puccinia sorghi]
MSCVPFPNTISVVKIFKGIKVNPNHHYTLHIPEQLALWRPLGGVAEWSGKWCIGKLCSLETKNWLGLFLLLALAFCQIKQLEAKEDLQLFLASEIPEDGQQKKHGRPVMVDINLYQNLLTHAHTINPVVCYYLNQRSRCTCYSPTTVCSSSITGPEWGQMAFPKGPPRTFFFWLYTKKTVLGFMKPGNLEIVPAKCIDTIAAYWLLPEATFCLSKGIILTPVNHLGSLEINAVTS